MHLHRLIRLATLFEAIAASETDDLPPNSKDLKTILSNLDKLETYQARKEYAENNLEHLSSGSSRIVYLSPDKTIIKMAKNDRGIAQNKVESNPKMTSQFLNKIISSSKDNVWLRTHFLDNITEKEFEEMTDIDFDDFGEAISYGLRNVSGNTDKDKPKHFDEVSKSDVYKEMKRLGEKFQLMPGDLGRISSFGKKDNQLILIDAGLNKEVFDKFYEDTSTKSSSKS